VRLRTGLTRHDAGEGHPMLVPLRAGRDRGKREQIPLLVCVLRMVPEASSSTECARRQPDTRQGRTSLLTFFTRILRSRYTRSMGNRMPKVWMASQGTIHKPSPEARLLRPSKPCCGSPARSATATEPASSTRRVRFKTFSRTFAGIFITARKMCPARRLLKMTPFATRRHNPDPEVPVSMTSVSRVSCSRSTARPASSPEPRAARLRCCWVGHRYV